jgi:hypothetical protein
MDRFPNLTKEEVAAAKKDLEDTGLKLPKIGWMVEFKDGRQLARDNKGYYWVRTKADADEFNRFLKELRK